MVPTLQLSAREQRQLDRELSRTLTQACDVAKAEVGGFAWVTHEVQWDDFPASLRVIWIFESNADIARALKEGWNQRLLALTDRALRDAEITVKRVEQHMDLDSEEECQRADAGNWRARLDRQHGRSLKQKH
tara:strand:- start:804 stop:1199 length:396 start_codon:yes stop_codon:yes gene_type:complete